MKILISIFVLLISFNLKAEYLHCDELTIAEGGGPWIPNLRKFHIFDIDLQNNFILNYEFEYNSDSKGDYPEDLLEFLISDKYNAKDYPKSNLKEIMSSPFKRNFKIIRNNVFQINAINTSNNDSRYRGAWLNLNLINGKGFLLNKRLECKLVEENIFGKFLSYSYLQ